MYKSNFLNLIINLFITAICMTSFIILLINQKELYTGYEYISLLPLSYLICHWLFIREVLKKYGLSIFLAVYLAVSFVRYSVLPYLVLKTGWYFGRSAYTPSTEYFQSATFLMIYELICYNIAILLIHKILFKNYKYNRKKLDFTYNSSVYIIFILFTGIMVLLRPTSLNFISFLSVNNSYVSLQDLDSLTSIVILFLSLARYIFYFVIIKYIIKLFQEKNPFIAFILISAVTIINSLIFFGTNRADFIFNFIISMIILIYLYGRYALVLNAFFVLLIPFVISRISTYRQASTITNGSNILIDITDYLQIYLGGIYNVAISLDLPSRLGQIGYLLADIFRSAIGPNVFLKNADIITSSQLFNYRIYLNDHVTQIIPMIGQGTLYLGYLFAPILGICFIFIAIYFTKIIVLSERFEMIFILMLISGRFGFVMAQNASIFLNELTFILPLFLIIYFLNNKVVINREKI